jgi:polysaccharide biosynthesis protein PslF
LTPTEMAISGTPVRQQGIADRTSAEQARSDGLSYGFVGTYPPTKCGIATFTASLARAMAPAGSVHSFGVVSCVDAPGLVRQPDEVVAELVAGSKVSRAAAALELNQFDVVVLQHEFGIFGGADGDDVLDLVDRLRVPLFVTLHTVVREPTLRQRQILESLAGRADAVIVQSDCARTLLLDAYDISPESVRLIQHGARDNLSDPGLEDTRPTRPTILTWGLIGPGKGIEIGIEAVAALRDLEPRPRYLVLGETHPKVKLRSGETYRDGLLEHARSLGVAHLIDFDDRYHDLEAILAQIRDADIVLLPYRSREQIVSGVLVEAIASGKPVVATRFPHAVELLAEGSGIVVPHDDSDAMAHALRSLLTDEALAARVASAARQQAPTLFWENVGRRYRRLARAAVHP